MPIDISLLRPSDEGGNIPLVERWQLLRNPSAKEDTGSTPTPAADDDNKSGPSSLELLNVLMDTENKRRLATNELNSCRHEIKSLQRQCRPDKNAAHPKSSQDLEAIRTKIQTLKTETIPELEHQVDSYTKTVDEHLLPMVHNQVDEIPFSSTRSLSLQSSETKQNNSQDDDDSINTEKVSNTKQKKQKEQQNKEVMDPLYCIGGYEKLCPLSEDNITDDDLQQNLSILTGVGSSLEQILTSHALSFLNNHVPANEINDDHVDNVKKQQFQLTHVPNSSQIKVPSSTAHSIMGLSHTEQTFQANISTEAKPMTTLPTYAILSMLQQNKNYSQSTLPLQYVAIAPRNDKSSVAMSTNDSSIKDTIKSKKNKKTTKSKSSIPDYVHSINQIHLFALCESHLYSSRTKQHEFANIILDFYQSLICTPIPSSTHRATTTTTTVWGKYNSSSCPMLRAYSISPSNENNNNNNNNNHHKLEPNEANRIIIEGYLPSTQQYIVLGQVSNFTDFISRSFKTRFGGGSHIKLGAVAHKINSDKKSGGSGNGGGGSGSGVTNLGRSVEYVHSVYGSFCSMDITMMWMLEHNMVQANMQNDNDESIKPSETMADGIALPLSLVVPYSHLWGDEYWEAWNINLDMKASREKFDFSTEFGYIIPFIRRKFQTKNGKIITRSIPNNTFLLFDNFYLGQHGPHVDNNSFLLPEEGSMTSANTIGKKTERLEIATKERREVEKESRPTSLLKSFGEQLSREEIYEESLCNPYEFLPFYK